MKALKALQSIIFTIILTVGTFLPLLISNPALAESSSGQTTLYFTNALNYENSSDFGFTPLSLTAPTKQNDSEYPPSLSNTEQWITWFSYAWISSFFQNSQDFNFSDFGNIFGDINLLFLLFPNPYRIVEGYTYNGNDSIKINGDISYNLYFKPPMTLQKSGDNATIGLYLMNMETLPPIKLIKNTTIDLTSGISNAVYNEQITLKDINLNLNPGDTLLFSVEIVPSNKTLSTLITKNLDLERWKKIASYLENRSWTKIKDIGTAVKDIVSLLEESNITSADITEIINSIISSSFIYDSANHPSYVTIPAKISEEDIRVYYLHTIPEMNENRPETKNQSGSIKLGEIPTHWTTEPFERNKILKVDDISANLYFDYYQILNILKGKITITVVLYEDQTTIASSEKELDRTGILDILTKPNKPITFTFSASDTEITYEHRISIDVSLKNGTNTAVKLLYDSSDYPSSLRVHLEETQNIKITAITSNPANRKIIPGGKIEYILNVTSEKLDTLQISSIERKKTGAWEITTPEPVSVLAHNKTNIHVFIKSLNNLKEAYNNTITLSLIISGNTGIARQDVFAEISKDAIQYNVEIISYSNNINVSKGKNHTFYFVIKNNNIGAIDDVDSYTITAISKNHWPLISRENIKNLRIGNSTDTDAARVVIQVPKNTTLNSDIITITVTSDGNPSAIATINLTVHVIGDDFLETIYNLFDNAAETIGLNDMFGSYGALVLISMLMVIILFILIILALMLTTKHVQIICPDRIKEIEVTETAIFELMLRNPSKKTQSYEIFAQQTDPSSKWMIAVEPSTIVIEGRLSKALQIIVTPTNSGESKDWTQVTVYVKKTGKKKTESIDLIAMIKEGKILLTLDNVSHWPTVFNPGEKVTTSCNISNKGTVSARNVKVFFYLNGKQKNIVDVTIPAGSIADLQIPWIAVKGKNNVRIRIKEQ
jgi:hypothetical protein